MSRTGCLPVYWLPRGRLHVTVPLEFAQELTAPQPGFRELAYQIADQFLALGSGIGVRVATIVGGMDTMSQQVALAKKPHIIVATPGRLQDHLENTKGFSLRTLKYLVSPACSVSVLDRMLIRSAFQQVMDEADRLLDLDFGPVIDKILKVLPREQRHTYLFSATMTTKVAKLQRASLRDPVKLEISTKSASRLSFKLGFRYAHVLFSTTGTRPSLLFSSTTSSSP